MHLLLLSLATAPAAHAEDVPAPLAPSSMQGASALPPTAEAVRQLEAAPEAPPPPDTCAELDAYDVALQALLGASAADDAPGYATADAARTVEVEHLAALGAPLQREICTTRRAALDASLVGLRRPDTNKAPVSLDLAALQAETDGKETLGFHFKREDLASMAVDTPDAAASIKDLQLAPTRSNLGPNPWGQVDFTAYTVEFGEVKVGFSNVMVGVAPHVQLGTSPLLDAARVPNVNVKAHLFQESAALRVIQKRNDVARKAAEAEGRPFTEAEAYRPHAVDVALRGNYTYLPRGAVTGSYVSAGSTVSWAVNRYWGLHAGADYALLDSSGELDFSTIGELALGRDVPPGTFAAEARLKGELATLNVATDLRFNRIHSLILQGSSTVYARSEANDNVETAVNFLNLDELLRYDGAVPLGEDYRASVAWHLAWHHLEARIGVGVSSVPGAWLTQATELSWRFGGPLRSEERRMNKSNTDSVKQKDAKRRPGGLPVPADPLPPAPGTPR